MVIGSFFPRDKLATMLNGADIQGLESVDLHLIPPTSSPHESMFGCGDLWEMLHHPRCQASAAVSLRPSPFWNVTRHNITEEPKIQLHNSIIWKVPARNSLPIPKNSCEHLLVYYSRDITMPNLTKFSHTRARTIHTLVQKLLQTIVTELLPPPIHTTFRKARLRLVFPSSL